MATTFDEIYVNTLKTGTAADTDKVTITHPYSIKIDNGGSTSLAISGSSGYGKIYLYDEGVTALSLLGQYSVDGADNSCIYSGNGKGLYIRGDGPLGLASFNKWIESHDDIRPYSDGVQSLGHSTRVWNSVYAIYHRTGDLCFAERTCPICGEKFRGGDQVVLFVNDENPALGTMTIPMHAHCQGKSAVVEVEVPETKIQYQLNDKTGMLEEYHVPKFEEVEENLYRIKQGYELDEKTGEFINRGNQRSAAREEAVEVITKKVERPVMKKIQIKVG